MQDKVVETRNEGRIMDVPKKKQELSDLALQRLPRYLQYLRVLQKNGVTMIAAAKVATYFHLGEIQVRKDLAAVSSLQGRPKSGFLVERLIVDIESYLGFGNASKAVLVGAGSLGKALLAYDGFSQYGLKLLAAFDVDKAKLGTTEKGKHVYSLEELEKYCQRYQIHIGVITVPAENAQEVCDKLVAARVLAVWNFAPVHLVVPEGVLVQNENMAVSLALLSKHLSDALNHDQEAVE